MALPFAAIIDWNLKRMSVTLVLCVLLVLGLAHLAVHCALSVQRVKTARRRQAVADRLDAVLVRAEREHSERRAAARASAALTTVLPCIGAGNRAPRRVS